ncbi:exosome complex exonuclease RRP44 [Sphaeroforma arctica JP610]|uniref:Ribosomal RNA-processing protein 44 n=1 Tax=Sphaeroforma arctica JP610 TaxID=667725 RepID=A0A0L0FN48_9EUKA|nr:exosome complex exonuclease RRP44 [Sphaeroforma arctica JP610]KNC77921.1 exosome complex exonuclease RRP44 [Sphaeroforma arctica JP610]|eukprot:XP_014151823.1 exosome complex exonuclease RRP44 [Sphaeroforma arctica JP610]
MLKSKTFVKKTRKGNVVKVHREHYMRDDVWCGAEHCVKCGGDEKPLQATPSAESQSQKFKFFHYILPDTNVVLHQIDLLEHANITNIIILQTVLDEVKNQNTAIYTRLRAIITNHEKHAYVFTNEHHRDVFVERLPKESSNDRNDRAIRVSTEWYNKHLPQNKGVRVVMLTNDRDNKRLAELDNIPCATIEQYVNGLPNSAEMVDLLALASDSISSSTPAGDKLDYPDYLAKGTVQAGIKSGALVQGTFNRSRENYLEGYVSAKAHPEPILLKGRLACNRAIFGDIVAVKLLPENEWEHPSKTLAVNEGDEEDQPDTDAVGGEAKNAPVLPSASLVPPPPCGKVVGIVKRNWRAYCGVLAPSKGSGVFHLFRPQDRSIPNIRIKTRQAESLQGKRIIVNIDGWERTSMYPNGHFVRVIGDLGDRVAEGEVILIEHDVSYAKFSGDVLACLPATPWVLTDEEVARRKDLRYLDVCSIDPPGCTDIDDALHARLLPNGNYEVGVHIADVTHFVQPRTAMDKEAASRGTTVYLTDNRIDMLPELLGSNLCSLRSNVDRLAFSCLWEMTPECEMVDVMFTKSVIRSKASLTYDEAQARVDDKTQQDDLTKSIRQLNKFAKILKARRFEAGALSLASPEVRFKMDMEDERCDPLEVNVKELKETNSLVEEFMLLANCTVAQRIHEQFPESSMLRRHPAPNKERFDSLVSWAKTVNVELDVSSSKKLAESLDKAVLPDRPYFNTLIRILTTRCMMQAQYFSSGTLPEEDYKHYGLAAPIYTHFTSPIRRYADVIVHRLLGSSIGWDHADPTLLGKSDVETLCDNLNYRHRNAQFAGRASVELYTHLFFKNRVVVEDGYIIRVKDNALIVIVPKYGFESVVYFDSQQTDYAEDKQALTLTTEDGKPYKFHMFDRLKVQIHVDSSNEQHQKLVMQLVEPHIPGLSVVPTDAMAVDEPNANTSNKRASPAAGPSEKKLKK